jgi:para-aminobenzoate synthetase component 1
MLLRFKTIPTNGKRLAFGYLSYDLKNDVESLQSNNFDGLHFVICFSSNLKNIFIKRKRA